MSAWVLAIVAIAAVAGAAVLTLPRVFAASEEPAPPPPPPRSPWYLVLQGPARAYMVSLGSWAQRHSSDVGGWVCADQERSVWVRKAGVEAQLGVVILDLWALLGADEAQATLERPCLALHEDDLPAIEAEVGGFQALDGWLLAPSQACFQLPDPDEIPRTLRATLRFPSTQIRLKLDRLVLLGHAEHRTLPDALPRDARPEVQRPQTSGEVAGVLAEAMARCRTHPALAAGQLDELFSAGLPEPAGLAASVCQVWGVCLWRAGRARQAVERFTAGLALVPDDTTRQQLLFHRGEVRLEVEGQLAAAREDFREALRLDPDDEQAMERMRACEQRLKAG